MIGFMLTKRVANKPFHTYNALYVSVSGGFSVPCMVVDSIMKQSPTGCPLNNILTGQSLASMGNSASAFEEAVDKRQSYSCLR